MRRTIQSLTSLFVFIATITTIIQSNHDRSAVRPNNRIADERNEGPTGAMAALDFWNQSRAYPNRDIPRFVQ